MVTSISSAKSQGFTMIELLVAIALSGMIFMGVSALMATLLTSGARSEQFDLLEQTKYDIQSELSTTIRWATSVAYDDTADMITLEPDTSYRFQNGRLYKNDTPLTSEDVEISDVELRNFTSAVSNPGLASLEVSLSMENKKFRALKTNLRFVVSQRSQNSTVVK